MLSLFIHNKNNVFSLSFHHLLNILLLPLQICVFASVCFVMCFYNFLFFQVLFHLFVIKFIFSFFYTMVVILLKEIILIVELDNLDFGIRDVGYEAKVFNRYGTFDQIANRSMEDLSYTYLHCDLLDKATLTTIILKVKSPYIEMHEQH